jgi:transglutaminase-like putative cysteine protease
MIERLFRLATRLESLIWLGLLGLSMTTIWGIQNMVRGLNQELLITVTLGGLLLGWMLARIRAPWWLTLILAGGAGFETTMILVGYLLPLVFALLRVILIYLLTLWRLGFRTLPEADPLGTALQDLIQGGSVVLTRLWDWFISLGQKGMHDPLPLQLVWGWALWCAAAWAAYLIWQNRQALLAIIPLGALLTVTIFFAGINLTALSVFLALALVLQAGNSWKRRQHRWQVNNIDWATDLVNDMIFTVTFLTLVIFLLSTITPQISISNLVTDLQKHLAWNGQQADNVAASFGIERRSPPPTRPPITPGGLPRRHLLGSGPELTRLIVMTIKTDDPPPAPPEEVRFGGAAPPTPHYWLAATFDIYNGRGWYSSPTTAVDLDANAPQLEPLEAPGRIVSQTVQLIEPFGDLLFTSGFPLQVDRPSQITFRANQDWAGTTVEADDVYTAQSWLPQPRPDDLNQVGTDYPDWISQRYLALPDNLSNRVRRLALELTATAPTPYERALALEEYLRAIPYSLDVPRPPRDQDVVEYFLFDLQKGYCDYYATSMAVLARAAGLPARFVIGYAPSPYDYRSGQYIVREAEAHSWVQIYFPGHGWIDFEPTGGRAPIDRSAEEDVSRASLPTLPSDFDIDSVLAKRQTWLETMPLWQVLLIGLTGLASLALVGLLTVWGSNQRLAGLPVEQLVPLLESRLERSARFLDIPLSVGATPLEFQAVLAQRLEHLAEKHPALQKFKPASTDIARLVEAFIQLRYAPHPVTASESIACIEAWRRLRWPLWGTIIVKRLRRIS